MSSATLTASAVNNAARRGSALGRRLLVISAWLVFLLFLVLPLFVVVTEALKQGVGVFFTSMLVGLCKASNVWFLVTLGV